MILIADSGSTKTDWAAVADDGGLLKTIRTVGLNPFQVTEEQIAVEAAKVASELASPASVTIHFYGAGCTPEKQPVVARALRRAFKNVVFCEVASDMLGAARAVCGSQPGICCILGTGSNSCAYDGDKIVKNVPPLGFILGDEGSGAVMGKRLVADVLKSQLPKPICDRFFDRYHLTQADIIERVYRQPKPNTFLASFMPFIQQYIGEKEIRNLVKESFREFLRRNVMQYDGWQTLPIGFVGSIAKIYRDILEEVAAEEGMHIGDIVQAPLEALVRQVG